jgi:peptide/nickel transport system permease protein
MKSIFKNLKNRPNFAVGGIIIVILVIVAIFAPWLAPYHPIDDANLMYAEEPPNGTFLLGTDGQGRDILSRIIHGARVSLSVGLLCQLLNSVIGISLGLLAGYFGKWVDDLIMGLTNVMLSIPPMVFALAIMAALGPGLFNVFLAIGVTNWSYECRITRSQVLSASSLDYVTASRALGYGRIRIMFDQILPNIVGPILVIASLGVGSAILTEAALSFLGLGAQPPTPSWGAMLSTARDAMFVAPWICIFPGIAIFITVLSLNLLGDGLRDILDPYSVTQRK